MLCVLFIDSLALVIDSPIDSSGCNTLSFRLPIARDTGLYSLVRLVLSERSLKDCQYQVHTHLRHYEGRDDIEYRTNIFFEIAALVHAYTNVRGHFIAFLYI